jgi:hypothetical protein
MACIFGRNSSLLETWNWMASMHRVSRISFL